MATGHSVLFVFPILQNQVNAIQTNVGKSYGTVRDYERGIVWDHVGVTVLANVAKRG